MTARTPRRSSYIRQGSPLVWEPAGAQDRSWVNIVCVQRDLHLREREALDALLAAEFPGVAELRAQAQTAVVVGGALILELAVDRSLPRATVGQRVPVQAAVAGDGYDGGLILFVDEGRLSGLEYWWVTEEGPSQFPPASAISAPVVTT